MEIKSALRAAGAAFAIALAAPAAAREPDAPAGMAECASAFEGKPHLERVSRD